MDTASQNEAIETYFEMDLTQKEIVYVLAQEHGIIISQRTLKRVLSKRKLFRRKNHTDILQIALFIMKECDTSNRQLGYRWMHQKCQEMGFVTTRETIRILLGLVDPDGVKLRTKRRLFRRTYISSGPNAVWHIDGYDKLKPYEICIHACIDGFSGYLIWLEAWSTNNDPGVIARYYVDAVRELKGCPERLRSDGGTENTFVAEMQCFFRSEHIDRYSGANSFLHGSSLTNQRIESWWSVLRKQWTPYWMDIFKHLKDDGYFTGDFVDKCIIQFCFLPTIKIQCIASRCKSGSVAMKFEVNIEDKPLEIEVNDGGIACISTGHDINILFEDVIGLEKSADDDNLAKLYHILEHPDNKLTKEKITFTAESNVFYQLQRTITSKIWTVTERPKKVAVYVNNVGGSFNGKQTCDDVVVPVLSLAGIQTDVVVSQRAGHAKEFAETYDFKSVDGIVIMGGDGTLSEICNVLMKTAQINAGVDLNDPNAALKTLELPIAIIPTGTWNGVVDALHGCKDILTSTLHIVKGKTSGCNMLGSFSGGELIGYATFCTGYAMHLEIPQRLIELRWMGSIRNILVPLWFILIRPFREINVEITYEYLEGSQPNNLSEEEKTSRKVTQKKTIINMLAFTQNYDCDVLPVEQQIKTDQFNVLDFKKCSRYSLLKHFLNFHQMFTKEHRNDVKDFLTFSEVTAFRLRVMEDNETTNDERNYLYNIDGEIYSIKTPDIYVKLFPRCYSVFSSYKGPKRWS